MKKVNIVFIILVYGNYNDVNCFYDSIKRLYGDFKIIVVDSYKDEESKIKGKKVSESIHADFIPVPNRGYGFGNNAGITYALSNYEFEYLVVSNPDIEVDRVHFSDVDDFEIMGPQVINDSGKNQNPHYYSKERFGFKLMKKYVLTNKSLFLCMYLIFNKIAKTFNDFKAKLKKEKQIVVYALHGSFFVMTKKTLEVMNPIFNVDMFLYAEENHIAELAKQKHVKMIYNSLWKVRHHENGSGNFNNSFVRRHTKHSLKVFFDMWES